jgi:hypothetical protein
VATCPGQNQITEETDVYQIFVGALIQLKAMSVTEAVNLGMDVSIPPTKSMSVTEAVNLGMDVSIPPTKSMFVYTYYLPFWSHF